MRQRNEYDQKICQALDLDMPDKSWWVNLRANGGLRLSEVGLDIFQNTLGLPSWSFDIDRILDADILIKLDRRLTCPYFIKRQRQYATVILFGDQEAVVASLIGDIRRYLDSLD